MADTLSTTATQYELILTPTERNKDDIKSEVIKEVNKLSYAKLISLYTFLRGNYDRHYK